MDRPEPASPALTQGVVIAIVIMLTFTLLVLLWREWRETNPWPEPAPAAAVEREEDAR